MVHLKIGHRTAGLTPPVVTIQDLLAQSFVGHRVQPQRGDFGTNRAHDAFSRRVSRKACRCSPGKVSFRKSRGEKSLRLLRSLWALRRSSGKVWIGSLKATAASGPIEADRGRSRTVVDVRLPFAYYGCVRKHLPCSICIRLARAWLATECSHHRRHWPLTRARY